MTIKNLPLPENNTTHAKLSASGASRWMKCPGSVALCSTVPNTTSEYASLGTYAHFIGSTCMGDNYGSRPATPGVFYEPKDWLGVEALVDGHKVVCDEEMVRCVEEYIQIVKDHAALEDAVFIEQDFTEALSKLHPLLGGISDAVILKRKEQHLIVYDYKHGSGVKVEVEDNTQMKVYALGALMQTGAPVKKVTVGIIQPRFQEDGETLRIWSFDAVEILDFAAELTLCATATEDFDAPLVSGSHCKFCPAAAKCPALEKHMNDIVSKDFEIIPGTIISMEQLSKALTIIPMVEERIRQLRELAYNEAAKGNPPPGFKLVQKNSHRKWRDPEQAKAVIDLYLGDEAYTQPALKSPSQIEKLLRKDLREIVFPLAIKPQGGYTLVPESDERAPAQLASPDDFQTIVGETVNE